MPSELQSLATRNPNQWSLSRRALVALMASRLAGGVRLPSYVEP